MTNHYPSYGRAIEEQLALWEWVQSMFAQRFLRGVFEAGRGRTPRSEAQLRMAMNVLEHVLRYGETFYWVSELSQLLEFSAAAIPEWTLTAQAVPAQNGFIWFEKSLPLPLDVPYSSRFELNDIRRDIMRLNQEVLDTNEGMEKFIAAQAAKMGGVLPLKGGGTSSENAVLVPNVGLVPTELVPEDRDSDVLGDPVDHDHPDVSFLEDGLADFGLRLIHLKEELNEKHRQLQEALDPNNPEEFGEQRDMQSMGWTTTVDDEGAHVVFEFFCNDRLIRPAGTPSITFNWTVGEPLSEVIAGIAEAAAHPADGIIENPDRGQQCARYAAAVLAFLEQEVVVPTATGLDRASRRRVAKWRPEPLVRVVRLRRIRRPDEPGHESEERDWAYRWMVRGHWRQQWYPSLDRHQAKWIGPYVKGPDDKPLKAPRAKIFAVVR